MSDDLELEQAFQEGLITPAEFCIMLFEHCPEAFNYQEV